MITGGKGQAIVLLKKSLRHRMYSPEMKRFISMDPLGYVDSMNMYESFGCDPVNNVDPLGLESELAICIKGIFTDVHRFLFPVDEEAVAMQQYLIRTGFDKSISLSKAMGSNIYHAAGGAFYVATNTPGARSGFSKSFDNNIVTRLYQDEVKHMSNIAFTYYSTGNNDLCTSAFVTGHSLLDVSGASQLSSGYLNLNLRQYAATGNVVRYSDMERAQNILSGAGRVILFSDMIGRPLFNSFHRTTIVYTGIPATSSTRAGVTRLMYRRGVMPNGGTAVPPWRGSFVRMSPLQRAISSRGVMPVAFPHQLTNAHLIRPRGIARSVFGTDQFLDDYIVYVGGSRTFHNQYNKTIYISQKDARNVRAWVDEMGHAIYDTRYHFRSYKALKESHLYQKLSWHDKHIIKQVEKYYHDGFEVYSRDGKWVFMPR